MAMTKPRRKPIDLAREWWTRRHERDEYVGSAADLPSAAVSRLLRKERLIMEVAGKRVWILTEPDRIDGRAILLQNYWPVVATIMERYAPSALIGADAVRVHLGEFAPPAELRVYHAASQSKLAIALEAEFRMKLRPGRVPRNRLQRVEAPGKASIAVLAPADLLGTLDETEIEADVEAVCSWLRHLVLRGPDIEAALHEAARPLIIQRLADLAAKVGNSGLAEQLDSASRRHSATVAYPARTGVGTRIEVPDAIRNMPRGSGTPWGDEQRMRLDRQRMAIRDVIARKLDTLPRFPVSAILAGAKQAKAYDAYHSTTMEGYRITPEAADAIVRGESVTRGLKSDPELQAAMAVQGYSIAFDRVLSLARSTFGKDPAIAGALILDLCEDLFRLSVDAGIVEPGALRGWRTSNASLRGWRHVPPNHRKIRDLIDGLEEFSRDAALDPVTRALLVHLEFVTIHPFTDGNGRLGRLLMNLCLMAGGLPWITVRSDERIAFFQAIETAQVDRNTKPFIEFLWHLIRTAVADVEKKSTSARRRKRPATRGKSPHSG